MMTLLFLLAPFGLLALLLGLERLERWTVGDRDDQSSEHGSAGR